MTPNDNKWKFEFSIKAKKQFEKLDNATKIRIRDYILKLIESGKNPRLQAKQLTGVLGNFWRFRIGDYRLICSIEEDQFIILAVQIAHRREVYDFKP